MPLIDLASKDPTAFADYSIEQVVAICGNGKLSDNSVCAEQLRQFLRHQTVKALSRHANHCLDHKFDRSGFVLQDVVNEIGRRLGYQVTSGRYAGTVNAIGYDGLWFDGARHLVVEVKTTDAYRINLDTLCRYQEKLGESVLSNSKSLHTLIVVGRQDTGDLEAQVRGSRHAWTVRLISVEALIKLMIVNDELGDPALLGKVQKILMPFEYTRVDDIVDLVFETQKETENKVLIETEVEREVENASLESKLDSTPRAEIELKRQSLVNSFFLARGLRPILQNRSSFYDEGNLLRVSCAISKRYDRTTQPYWYALHPQWMEFMRDAQEGYLLLGCMDRDNGVAIPYQELERLVPSLNETRKTDRAYWHIVLIEEDGALKLNLSKIGKKVDLTQYSFSV